jgi:hypothetical protein
MDFNMEGVEEVLVLVLERLEQQHMAVDREERIV